MQSVYKLLLSLAVASAVVSGSMRFIPDATNSENAISNESESETKTEGTSTLIKALSEHFKYSSEMLQNYLRNDADATPRYNEANDVVRIVVMEQDEVDPAEERKTACLKAMEVTRTQQELEQQTKSYMRFIRSAFDMVSLQVWGGPSCNDLDRPELVELCNLVLRLEDVVQLYRLEGKSDDQVCEIMATVTDLDTKESLSCQLCQRFVQMIDQAVSEEVEQVEHVRDIIGDLGDVMSSDSLCLTFYNNYDTIVQLVKYGTQSSTICSRLTMCSGLVDVYGL